MVEKGIRGGICHAIHRYTKTNIQYLDANNFYGWATSQKSPVHGFKWKKNMLKFTKDFT